MFLRINGLAGMGSLGALAAALLSYGCSEGFESCTDTRSCPDASHKDDGGGASGAAAGGSGGQAGGASSGGTGGATSSAGNAGKAGGTTGSGGSTRDAGTSTPDAAGDATADSGEPDASRVHPVPCDATHLDCDGVPDNGCESDVSNDVDHCGACAVACAANGTASRSCQSGQCKPACDPSHLDCNGDGKDGCEVSSEDDAANCGACKVACSTANASSTSCVKGVCAPVCTKGFANCSRPNGTGDDGCETSLTSPTSCGACGRDCGGGPCNATTSTCDPLTYASGIGYTGSIAVDANYVHYVEGDAANRVTYVRRVPVRGGQIATVTSTATNGDVGSTLAVDSSYVYWCDGRTPAIRRLPIGMSGDGTILVSDSSLVSMDLCPLAVDGTNVYWTDYGLRQIWKMPKDASGPAVALTQPFGSAAFSLFVDATNVYFSEPAFAPIVPATPAAYTSYRSGNWASGEYITIDDKYVYGFMNINGQQGLFRVAKNMSGSPQFIGASDGDAPMTTDASYLYAVQKDGIYRYPKAGGARVRVATDASVNALVVDGNGLYWVSGPQNSTASGAVRRLAL